MIVGIAGGIGAGKSVVTNYLRRKGYYVIDADEVAREAVLPGEPALGALTSAFGEDILGNGGELDRARLAAKAFADEDSAQLLNDILHGDIARRIEEKLRTIAGGAGDTAGAGNGAVFLSAPLMFESGTDKLCDEVWLISAPEEVRLTRASKRDGTTPDGARARAARQMSEGDRRARAGVIIENTGNKRDLYSAVDRELERITGTGA
jgi:dephospho-CoA kinase